MKRRRREPAEDVRRLALLEAAAERLGVRVRAERLGPAEEAARPVGGLVRLKGAWLVVLDRDQPARARAAVLAGALRQLSLSGVYLPPAVREWLEDEGGQG